MAENDIPEPRAQDDDHALGIEQDIDPETLLPEIWQMWWRWADFELFIINPILKTTTPPTILQPEPLPNSEEREFVYPIHDWGYKLIASKGEEMFHVGASNCKLFFTIEKMIYLLIERLKTGGITEDTEVQVAFGGHPLAQRKAFESIINSNYNIVITNFNPGLWGERYLQIVKQLAEKGYNYPSTTPRDTYRQTHSLKPKLTNS